MKMPQKYEYSYKITSYDGDKFRELRQSSQMKIQQEAGERHLVAAGYPYLRLCDEFGFIFVMTRIVSKIYRLPVFGDDVTVKTWTYPKGAQYMRCFEMRSFEDELLLESCGAYAVVDAKSHRLMRPTVVKQLEMLNEVFEVPGCGEPAKIPVPGNLEVLGTRKIRYSDLDYNGHLNNTVYLDFISDFMPLSMDDFRVTGFSLQYICEAREEDELLLEGKVCDNVFYLSGSHSRGKCFVCSAAIDKR